MILEFFIVSRGKGGKMIKPSPAPAAVVTLQPLALCWVTGVYRPSKLRRPKSISYNDFLSKYADSAFENNGLTMYAYGLDCWYFVKG